MPPRPSFLTRPFWLSTLDPRPFALFRIAFGLVVLHDLVDYLGDLRAFVGDEGMLPRTIDRGVASWSVFDLVGSNVGIFTLFFVGFLAVVAFTVGWRTRIAAFVSWLLLISLHHRNAFVTDGGDELARNLMLLSIFVDLGAVWSIDARRDGPKLAIPAFPARVLQLYVALLYLVTGLLKARFGWTHGIAVFQALQLSGFVRPPGAWLLAHPALCRMLTYGTLVVELGFPFLAFSPIAERRARAIAVASAIGLQLGLLSTMKVGIFTETMLAACFAFFLPEWLDRFAPIATDLQNKAIPTLRTRTKILYAVLGAHLAVLAWTPFFGRRFPVPSPVRRELQLIGLTQAFDLFTHPFPVTYWEGHAVRDDGTNVEVISVAAPGMRSLVGWSFSRWYKFTFKEAEMAIHYPELARWLCRRYEERTSTRLVSLTIVRSVRAAVPPGVVADAPKLETLYAGDCHE